jgi:hypothetical protein
MAGSTQLAGAPQQAGEQTYTSGLEEWMRGNPDLMELYRSGEIDPNLNLDVDQPSAWSLRHNTPTQPISDVIDRAAFLRAFSI